MSAPRAVAEPAPPPATGRPVERARSSPAVPALASGLILYFAYPPADRGYLAWFALVPLLLLVGSEKSRRSLYLGAWAGGLAFWLLSVIWIWELHPSAWVAWLALAGYQSVYWPLFLLLARVMVRRQRLPLMLAAPIAWVGLEYVQAYALSGFPWYYLAHSQYRALPLIQVSDLFGAWAVSGLVVAVNAWIAELLTRPVLVPTRRGARPAGPLVLRTGALLLLMGGTLAYGYARLSSSRFADGPRVALLQSNIRQEMKTGADPREILAIYRGLIARAIRAPGPGAAGLDLIVWPETSFPLGYVGLDPATGPEELDRRGRGLYPETRGSQWLARQGEVDRLLADWSREAGSPFLVGSLLYDLAGERAGRYNAAILFDPDGGERGIYRKIHLVPFGEYVPLLGVFPWIKRLTPYEDQALPTLEGGPGPVWFDSRGVRYATAICFEDTVPHLVRRFFAEAPDGREPDVLVNISNDGWFRGSAEHDVHLAIGVFRAVEHRVPLVRAVNAGISAIVDGDGRVVRQVPKLEAGVIADRVPLDPRTSLYTRHGDWLGQACFAVCLGLGLLGALGWPRGRDRGRGRRRGWLAPPAPLAQGADVG